MHNRLKLEKGRIELLNQRVCMFPLDMLVDLQKNLELQSSDNLVYFSAKKTGVTWFKNMYNYFKISRADVIKWGFNVINLAGWGVPSITKMDTQEEILIFTLVDAGQANLYGKSNFSVDHYFRGCAASAGILLLQKNCDAVETKCISKGDGICEFVVKPKEKFDLSSEIVKKQLFIQGKYFDTYSSAALAANSPDFATPSSPI